MKADVDALNQEYALQGRLFFRQLAPDIVVAEVDSPLATATISLYGGQVVNWWTKHQQLPDHGYARISPWVVAATELTNDGAIRIRLAMQDTDMSLAHFPRSIRLSVQITVAKELTVALTTENGSNQDVVLTEGLHTYFKVGDISAIQVLGLEGAQYLDLTRGNTLSRQEGPIRFDGELGRIFTNSTATCVIEDPSLARRITTQKKGSLSTAVWNPWAQTSAKMADLGEDGWRDMVCVESANALENLVTIKSGTSHTHTAVYSAESVG